MKKNLSPNQIMKMASVSQLDSSFKNDDVIHNAVKLIQQRLVELAAEKVAAPKGQIGNLRNELE